MPEMYMVNNNDTAFCRYMAILVDVRIGECVVGAVIHAFGK